LAQIKLPKNLAYWVFDSHHPHCNVDQNDKRQKMTLYCVILFGCRYTIHCLFLFYTDYIDYNYNFEDVFLFWRRDRRLFTESMSKWRRVYKQSKRIHLYLCSGVHRRVLGQRGTFTCICAVGYIHMYLCSGVHRRVLVQRGTFTCTCGAGYTGVYLWSGVNSQVLVQQGTPACTCAVGYIHVYLCSGVHRRVLWQRLLLVDNNYHWTEIPAFIV